MSNNDKHNTRKLSNFIAVGVAVFFVIIAIAGYQAADDLGVLVLFSALAVVGFFVVKLLFLGINKLLDSLDREQKD